MLLLDRADVASLLPLPACIEAVEEAFRSHAQGRSLRPAVASVAAGAGMFHVKAAGLVGRQSYFAAKTNANFPGNPARSGRPAIQGVIVLFDAETGVPLALLDSIEITIRRTGAATAVAARHLARPDSSSVFVLGCGNQGRIQLEALCRVLPLRTALVYDAASGSAERFAAESSGRLGLEVEAVSDRSRTRDCPVIVTCTPSREPLLSIDDVPAGAFVAAVGADSPDKQELDPRILASHKVVVDLVDQCAEFGELHHALRLGLMRPEAVHAELSDVVAGTRTGRETREEVIVFDSTGTALQDVAAAALVYERARELSRGIEWSITP